ncbi:MAG TPA: alpha/beta fold hydrolase, partial [Nannocystis exedens]|nr:alpha/beta fold hydrolase [Nannocystis exedens]
MRRHATFLTVRGLIASIFLLDLACAPKEPELRPPELSSAMPEPAPSPAPEPENDPREAVDWAGNIVVPGSPMRMIVHLQPEADNTWKGTLDLPQSGLKGHAIRDLDVSDEGFDFVLAPAGTPEARWVYIAIEHEVGADVGRGTFEQAGQSFPVEMHRLAPGEEYSPRRPQTPVAPFPYLTRDLEITQGEIQLACTLVVPKGDAIYPAVVLLSGSGVQDRDSTIFDHKPFAVLADHLARASIASLRCDDRGVGGSTGAYRDATHEMLTKDALAMVQALAGDARIDPRAIGIIGHSEGGMLAPMAAAAAPKKVAFIVLLAGPGFSGAEILSQQSHDIGIAMGKEPAAVEREDRAHRAFVKALLRGANKEVIVDKLQVLVELQLAGREIDDASKTALIHQSLDQMTSPWFISFIASDPQPALRKLKKTPVLALGGDLDLQVRAKDNLQAIQRGLKRARNRD